VRSDDNRLDEGRIHQPMMLNTTRPALRMLAFGCKGFHILWIPAIEAGPMTGNAS
jgi:hypothetical protein